MYVYSAVTRDKLISSIVGVGSAIRNAHRYKWSNVPCYVNFMWLDVVCERTIHSLFIAHTYETVTSSGIEIIHCGYIKSSRKRDSLLVMCCGLSKTIKKCTALVEIHYSLCSKKTILNFVPHVKSIFTKDLCGKSYGYFKVSYFQSDLLDLT